MTSIQPITEEQQALVRNRSHELIRLAAGDLGKKVPEIEIKFDLSGRSAGMYCSQRRERWIRYNPYIFAKYFDENFNNTVPHEVAHYLTDVVTGRKRVAPHGQEWQTMMQLLGCEPETTHKFDLDGVPVKRQRRHLYRCGCQDHQLSSTRHNRVQRQKKHNYFCRNCGEALSFVKESGNSS